MLTDFQFALRDQAFLTLLLIPLAGLVPWMLAALAIDFLIRQLGRKADTLGVRLTSVGFGLGAGLLCSMLILGHPGKPARALLFDGPAGLHLAVVHDASPRKGRTKHLVRGRALTDGSVLFQTPPAYRVAHLGERFVWMDDGEGPAAFALYTGAPGAVVAEVVKQAGLPGTGEFKVKSWIGELLEVKLQDGAPGYITPAGALSRTAPSSGSIGRSC